MTAIRVWFGKDVRRLARWLLVWIGVLSLRLVLATGWVLPNAFGAASLDTLTWIATTALFVLLTALVVLEDPPTDPKAFWPARPISFTQLLLEKSLFLGLLLVVPVTAVDVAEVSGTGIDRRLVALAVPEALLDWGAWSAVVMLLASLSTSLTDVVRGAGRLVAAVLLPPAAAAVLALVESRGHWWLPFWDLSSPFTETAENPLWISLVASRAIALRIAVVATALGFTAWTFVVRHRRWRWTAVTVAIALLTMGVWTWNWSWFPLSTTSAATDLPAVDVTLDPAGRVSSETSFSGFRPPDQRAIEGRFTISSLPPPHAAELTRVTGRLDYRDGGASYPFASWPPRLGIWNVDAIEAVVPGIRILKRDSKRGEFRELVAMPLSEFEHRRGVAGHVDLAITVAIRRYVVTGTLPLAPGERLRHGGDEVMVDSLIGKEGHYVVSLRGAHVSLLLVPEASTVRGTMFFRYDPTVLYLLVNRRRGEALLEDQLTTFGFGWSRSRVDKVTWVLNFDGTRTDHTGSILDADWLRDAELVRLDAVTEGEVVEHVERSDFAIDASVPVVAPPEPELPPQQSPAHAPQPTDDPNLVTGTLDDQALMALDWYSPTPLSAGMQVTARRNVPGRGVEFDVQVDASPDRGVPDQDVGDRIGAPPRRWRPRVEGKLNVLSSARGGAGTLVGTPIARYDAIALRFTLVAIDGRPPGYETPRIGVGVVADDSSMTAPANSWLQVPEWSVVAWNGPGGVHSPHDPTVARQLGFVVEPNDPRWRNRAARFTLRVEPVDGALPLQTDEAHRARQATLSRRALSSLGAGVAGNLFIRQAEDGSNAIDVDVTLQDRQSAFLRFPDEVAEAIRARRDDLDMLVLRVTLLAVDGDTGNRPESVGIMFLPSRSRLPTMASLAMVERSFVVSTSAAEVTGLFGLDVSRVFTSDDEARRAEERPSSVSLRLEPFPGVPELP